MYTGAFGERDASTGEPVEEDTVFQIPRSSATFTRDGDRVVAPGIRRAVDRRIR